MVIITNYNDRSQYMMNHISENLDANSNDFKLNSFIKKVESYPSFKRECKSLSLDNIWFCKDCSIICCTDCKDECHKDHKTKKTSSEYVSKCNCKVHSHKHPMRGNDSDSGSCIIS